MQVNFTVIEIRVAIWLFDRWKNYFYMLKSEIYFPGFLKWCTYIS